MAKREGQDPWGMDLNKARHNTDPELQWKTQKSKNDTRLLQVSF